MQEIEKPFERVAFGDGWLGSKDEGGGPFGEWVVGIHRVQPVNAEPLHWGTIGMVHNKSQPNDRTAALGWLDGHASPHTSPQIEEKWETWIGIPQAR